MHVTLSRQEFGHVHKGHACLNANSVPPSYRTTRWGWMENACQSRAMAPRCCCRQAPAAASMGSSRPRRRWMPSAMPQVLHWTVAGAICHPPAEIATVDELAISSASLASIAGRAAVQKGTYDPLSLKLDYSNRLAHSSARVVKQLH